MRTKPEVRADVKPYRLRLACGRLFFRTETGTRARSAVVLHDTREILVSGSLRPEDLDYVFGCIDERLAPRLMPTRRAWLAIKAGLRKRQLIGRELATA